MMGKKRGRPSTKRADLAATLFMMMYAKETGERRARRLAQAAIDAGLVDIKTVKPDSALQRLERAWSSFQLSPPRRRRL